MCQPPWCRGSAANDAATSGAPVTLLVPSEGEQCAAVSITVDEISAPEQVLWLSVSRPTYGCPSPSGWPPTIAPADAGSAQQATSAASQIVRRIRVVSARGPRYLHPNEGLCAVQYASAPRSVSAA